MSRSYTSSPPSASIGCFTLHLLYYYKTVCKREEMFMSLWIPIKQYLWHYFQFWLYCQRGKFHVTLLPCSSLFPAWQDPEWGLKDQVWTFAELCRTSHSRSLPPKYLSLHPTISTYQMFGPVQHPQNYTRITHALRASELDRLSPVLISSPVALLQAGTVP
jgi:hypothetical protein